MENLEIIRTNSENEDFRNLVKFLDNELAVRDGDDHAFYHQFNRIDMLNNCIVAYYDKVAVGIGAVKPFDDETMEVKRMYVLEKFRGQGIASIILKNLENWTQEIGFAKCILETGINQPEAISLYKKSNYDLIENYGQYKDVATSRCFLKILKP